MSDDLKEFCKHGKRHPDSTCLLCDNEQLKQLLSDSQKREAMLRDEILLLMSLAQTCLDNAHWEVKFGSGDLINEMIRAKCILSSTTPPPYVHEDRVKEARIAAMEECAKLCEKKSYATNAAHAIRQRIAAEKEKK